MLQLTVPENRSHPSVVAGSFRDPAGFVFEQAGVLFRQVNESYRADFDRAVGSGLVQALIERQCLVKHEEVPVAGAARPGAYRLLRPERIPFVSYPFEWSFSQLRDAALLTIDVQRLALEHGMCLKDASAYNVQFLRGRPILIDTLSFEAYEEGAPWVAYRQFCQHFLAPLALMAKCDVRLGQLFRVFIDGVPLELASRLMPRTTWLKPALAMHLHLHARAQRRFSNSLTPAPRPAPIRRASLLALLGHLKSAVEALRWSAAGTEWADYYSETNYSDDAASEKQRLVDRMLQSVAPASVWDLGANTGRFSHLASSRGILTMAFDVDPAAVDRNYRECVANGNQFELPLVLDLTNPSPGFGWAGSERMSLESRGPADLIMALALVHHLAIANNVPLEKIAAFLARNASHLIIEFVPKSDSQVRRLLASRADVFGDYTPDGFEAAFSRHFSIEASEPIRGSERVLYLMRRRQHPQGSASDFLE